MFYMVPCGFKVFSRIAKVLKRLYKVVDSDVFSWF